jgi:hypothetical protein
MKEKYLLEVNVLAELHVLCMDAKDLKPTGGIRDTDVNFAIEATESAKSWVDGVRSIGGGHYHNIRARFETVHQSQ